MAKVLEVSRSGAETAVPDGGVRGREPCEKLLGIVFVEIDFENTTTPSVYVYFRRRENRIDDNLLIKPYCVVSALHRNVVSKFIVFFFSIPIRQYARTER